MDSKSTPKQSAPISRKLRQAATPAATPPQSPDHGSQTTGEAGGRLGPSTPRKRGRKPGKPNRSKELVSAERRVKRQQEILNRQRDDCKSLAIVIDNAASQPDGGAGERGSPAAAAANLARATQILHALERQAHEVNERGSAVNKIILMPVTLSITDWAAKAGQILGDTLNGAQTALELEPDVLGAPPDTDPDDSQDT